MRRASGLGARWPGTSNNRRGPPVIKMTAGNLILLEHWPPTFLRALPRSYTRPCAPAVRALAHGFMHSLHSYTLSFSVYFVCCIMLYILLMHDFTSGIICDRLAPPLCLCFVCQLMPRMGACSTRSGVSHVTMYTKLKQTYTDLVLSYTRA